MSVKLSVNINKLATLRNARGGNNPNIIQAAIDIESFGAEGITVHPRPDERHIRYADVMALKSVIKTEFNIEGYPDEQFLQLIEKVKPEQVTLVPDAPEVLTSNNGWDTAKHQEMLTQIVNRLHKLGCRVSLFLNPDPSMVASAKQCGADRIELYTEAYASGFSANKEAAIANYISTAEAANKLGLGINAGHDLDLNNLAYFAKNIPNLLEVSIGHALICDSIYLGLQNTVQMYKRCLKD